MTPSPLASGPPPLDPPAALPRTRGGERRVRPWAIAALLFLSTLFTTTTLGAGFFYYTRTDFATDLPFWIGPETVGRVWSDPELLATGLSFALPLVLILLCHEFGHYFACVRRGLPATPPFFLPLPIFLGTLGAFIRIRAPIRDRRELLEVGVSGPLAGFAALLPFLVYGLARSTPATVTPVSAGADTAPMLLVPGANLAMALGTRLFHGPLSEGAVLDLHPFALAAWFGLLATALNLLPIGQLDGGHILFAAAGELQRRLAPALWAGLALIGLAWPGWLIWCAILLVIGIRHPPVSRMEPGLDRGRLGLALLALALLALSFSPVPLVWIPVAG